MEQHIYEIIGLDIITLNLKTNNIKIAEYLLERESKNKHPPNYGFRRIQGIFEIVFKTDRYIQWVNRYEASSFKIFRGYMYF